MAPRATYDPPQRQLGALMVDARRRGLDFETWWIEAMRPGLAIVMVTHPDPPAGAVRWPTDRADRVTWLDALIDSKDGWRRAFERSEPTAAERALRDVADAIDLIASAAELVAA